MSCMQPANEPENRRDGCCSAPPQPSVVGGVAVARAVFRRDRVSLSARGIIYEKRGRVQPQAVAK